MSVNWTAAQKAAIELRGGSVLVSAAAGSGKTAVLVERAVQLITGPSAIPADRLLVITFTKAAAGELKTRLYEAVDMLRNASPLDPQLRRQSILVRRAEIGTIDAFCQRLVRENFQDTPLPVDFRIGSSATMKALRAAAMEQTLNEMYRADHDFVTLSTFFGRARSDEETEQLLFRLYDFFSTVPSIEQYKKGFRKQLLLPLEQTEMRAYCISRATAMLVCDIQLLDRAVELCGQDEMLAAYLPSLEDADSQLRNIYGLLQQGELKRAEKYLVNMEFADFGRAKKEADQTIKQTVSFLRNYVKKNVGGALRACLISDPLAYEQSGKSLELPLNALFAAIERFDANYAALKTRSRCYDHSDIARTALELLTDAQGEPTQLAREISSRYDQVMIDEYQDTNGIQNAIFRAVASPNMSNAFAVGDIKQSIYSFRNAEPEIFLQQARGCADYTLNSYPCIVRLNENFRSTVEVTQGINAVFDRIMTLETCGLSYAGNEQLNPAGGNHTTDGAGFELVALNTEKDNDYAAEARYVAARIKQMVTQGFQVNKGGQTRPCEWGDFAVLLRSPKDCAPIYKTVLELAGIPVYSETQGSFFDYDEVNGLISILEAINNPTRDVALAALLTDRYFDFTADELLKLRMTDRKAGLYTLLLRNSEQNTKAARALDFLQKYRTLSCSIPADELVRKVAQELQTQLFAAAGNGGEKRAEALRSFFEFTAEAAKLGNSLAGLLKLARQAQSDSSTPAGSTATVENAVVITSVHKSKGLEWPVVFSVAAGKDFNFRDLSKAVLLSRNLGIGMRIFLDNEQGVRERSETPQYQAIKTQLTEKLAEEEMRILYVALTRARDKIMCVGSCADTAKNIVAAFAMQTDDMPASEYVKNARNQLDWLFSALYCGGYFSAANAANGSTVSRDGVTVSFPFPPQTDCVSPEEQTFCADEQLSNEIAGVLRWRYPNLELCGIPAKISVSALTETHMTPAPQRPAFDIANNPTAALRGTALHEFMQYADYALAAGSVPAEIARLAEKGYIPAQTAEIIDVPPLQRLFSDSFMQNILACPRVLREYEFFYMLPASEAFPTATECDEKVLVQGIADCVCVYDDHAVIIDYKSDRVSDETPLLERYSAQLAVYSRAVAERLGLRVSKKYIWSFALNRAVELP